MWHRDLQHKFKLQLQSREPDLCHAAVFSNGRFLYRCPPVYIQCILLAPFWVKILKCQFQRRIYYSVNCWTLGFFYKLSFPGGIQYTLNSVVWTFYLCAFHCSAQTRDVHIYLMHSYNGSSWWFVPLLYHGTASWETFLSIHSKWMPWL